MRQPRKPKQSDAGSPSGAGLGTGAGASGELAAQVIDWQRLHGRHHLPWQRPQPGRGSLRDPYRVWLSEVMLQQTQVATVIPYFEAFTEAFGSVAALAGAPNDRVMALWSGLGYYSRARNLLAAARQIVVEHGGVFPDTALQLEQLPGVGRSTAAAIAVFAFGRRAAILDGNVKRVFSRVFAVAGHPADAAVARQLWALAESELPGSEATAADLASYTQGLMDIGATVCLRTRPACERCPLNSRCAALALDSVAQFPTTRPTRRVPARPAELLLLRHADSVLLEERPPSGLWGGLWSLPEFRLDGSGRPLDPLGLGLAPEQITVHGRFEHQFTHFRMQATIWGADVDASLLDAASSVRETVPLRWLALGDVASAPLPQPIKRLLSHLAVRPARASDGA